MVLELPRASESPGGLVQTPIAKLLPPNFRFGRSWVWGLKIKFPGKADGGGSGSRI